MTETYLTTKQLHDQFSIFSEQYWRQLRMKPGGGPKFIKIGNRVLYKKSAVEAWIESQPSIGSTMEYDL
jgi:predicted DNA-binding transcriptional regulator AlpA